MRSATDETKVVTIFMPPVYIYLSVWVGGGVAPALITLDYGYGH